MARGDILELAVYAGCLLTIGIGMWALFIIIDWVGIDDALSEEALTATRESRGEELHTGSSQLRDVTARRHGEGL